MSRYTTLITTAAVALMLFASPPAQAAPDDRPRGPHAEGDRPHPPMPHPEKVKVPFLGVATGPVDPPLRAQLDLPEGVGLVLHFVEEDSPAAKAGLERFTVLHKLGDQLLVNHEQLRTLIHTHKPGEKVTLTVITGGKSKQVDVTLGEKEIVRMPHPPGPPHLHGEHHEREWRGEGPPPWAGGAKFELRGVDREKMIEKLRDNLRRSGMDEAKADEIIERMRKQWQQHDGAHFRLHRVDPHDGRGDAGPRDGADGERPRIIIGGNGQGAAQSIIIGGKGGASIAMTYSDGEHTLKVSGDKEDRELVATDKQGNVVFEGPINTPEQLEKLPAEIREKLERLEKTTRLEIRINGAEGRIRPQHDRPQPKPEPRGDKPVDI